MKRFESACLALGSVCLAGVVAAGSRPQYGGVLRVEIDAPIRAIVPGASDPGAGDAPASARISAQVFEPLVSIEGDGLRPRLAASWAQEQGGARWRFHLRSGVRLHDGALLESWQAAASLRASEPTWNVSADGDAVVIDPGTPSNDLPWSLADERHAVVVRGAGGAVAGTGPFRLDRVDGSRILLRAHDAYWRARPFVDSVQIDTGRRFEAQLADLEAGRADVVAVRAIDARRAARRGSRVEASKPLDLVALIFEPHRVADGTLSWRRTIAATLNRDAICSVVLQGHGVAARSLLPAWISGFASIVAPPPGPTLTRTAVAALPIDMREFLLRVDGGDAVLQAIADRIAVDAREAGFSIKVQTPAGLAPRADVRLVRIGIPASSPDRAFAQAAARLTVRGWPKIAAPDTAGLAATWTAETSLVNGAVVVPVVHVPELYSLGERVGFSARPLVNATGGWNLADAWVRAKP